MIWQGDEGEENVFMMKGGYEKSDEIIAQIEASSFTGDTLIQSGDNKVRIRKKDGTMEVQLESGGKSDNPEKEARIEIKKN
jgi:hypothetical protein